MQIAVPDSLREALTRESLELALGLSKLSGCCFAYKPALQLLLNSACFLLYDVQKGLVKDTQNTPELLKLYFCSLRTFRDLGAFFLKYIFDNQDCLGI